MNEHVFAAVVTDDEPETLLAIEEFDRAGAFAHDLGRHAATTAATAAAAKTAAAATAATETAAAAAAITEAATTAAAAETATITKAASIAAETASVVPGAAVSAAEIGISFELRFSETIPLVPAAPAASSVKTHALLITFARPFYGHHPCRTTSTETRPKPKLSQVSL
ncbi:hypothetical protein HNP60_003809 [Sphingobium sp. B1D3A]|uniref:Uncharacterized protein n=1 Tax=Sphingobium lignivorans TaxID=2735886 RepID=A0ABR6NKM4_9SPHN|nr:hypothetical protein [Sphingobium lignivorans]